MFSVGWREEDKALDEKKEKKSSPPRRHDDTLESIVADGRVSRDPCPAGTHTSFYCPRPASHTHPPTCSSLTPRNGSNLVTT